ncbi:MAG: MFS transporter [Chloroflexi bacterium]|nr:MFS transporter [Chloroflexota bacterium]
MIGDRRSVAFLALVTFFFWASLYVYVPILAVYARSMGASLGMVGMVVGAYGVSQLLLRIPLGIQSDRHGRRLPYVAGALVAASLGALGLALAPDPWALFLARGLTGAAASGWVVFSVLFAAYFPQGQVPRAMGLINFVSGLAQMAATLLGGLVAEGLGWRETFLMGAVLSGLGLVCLAPVRERPMPRGEALSAAQTWRLATAPGLLVIAALSGLTQYTTYSTTFGFTTVYASGIGASRADLGLLTTLFFAAVTVGSLATGPLMERYSPRTTLALGMAMLGVATLLTPLTGTLWPLGVVQLVTGVGRGVTQPALMALAIQDVAPARRATAMGVYQALYAIGMFAGPPVSGAIAEALGLPSVFAMAGLTCLVAGLWSLLGLPQREGAVR